MTAADVQFLAAKLDKIEERLRMLEQDLAEKRGAEDARNMTRGTIALLIAAISCATGVTTAIVTHVI